MLKEKKRDIQKKLRKDDEILFKMLMLGSSFLSLLLLLLLVCSQKLDPLKHVYTSEYKEKTQNLP